MPHYVRTPLVEAEVETKQNKRLGEGRTIGTPYNSNSRPIIIDVNLYAIKRDGND